jgi:hypothetical protein
MLKLLSLTLLVAIRKRVLSQRRNRKMEISLVYRCQLLPDKDRNNLSRAHRALLRAGWNKDVLDRELVGALALAKTQILVPRREKQRRRRDADKARLRGDDALDEMFRAAGCDPADIPRRKDFAQGRGR